MIVDGHFHVWPDRIAQRALANPPASMVRFGDGTAAGAIAAQRAAGLDRSVCLGVANTADRVDGVNTYVGALDEQHFIGFGTVHPDLSPEANLASLRANGLRGVKIHPLFQGYALDDPRLRAVLDALRGEFAVVVHVGHGGEGAERCTPRMMRDLVLALPGLDVIACHFGGYGLLDDAEEQIIGLPIHVDTSWPPGLAALDPARVRRIIERHGSERVVFASDWPMADPAAEIAAVRALGLADDETTAILGPNLERLLAQLARPDFPTPDGGSST